MSLKKIILKEDELGTFFISFDDFNQKKFFSISHDHYKLSFYFYFEEEKLQPENSSTFTNDYSKYIDIYYQLFNKATILKEEFRKETDIDCFYYFDDLFKHSIYTNDLSEYLYLDSISDKLCNYKITTLCQSKYAFNYFFINYFCNEYYFNIFEPISYNKDVENFFDFIYDKLDKNYMETMKFLFIPDEFPFFQFFMSIEKNNLSFNDIIINMMKKNYKFNASHIDFFRRYFSSDFYSYALKYMDKEQLQIFTFEYGFVIDEYEYVEPQDFFEQINLIDIPDYIINNGFSYEESCQFLSGFFSTIEEHYTYEDLIDNMNTLYLLFEKTISNMNGDEIKYTQNEINTKLFNLLLEQFHIKQNIKDF